MISQALSVEVANRVSTLSIANAASNAASIVSQKGSVISVAVDVASNAASIVSQKGSVISVNLASVQSQVSTALSQASAALSTASVISNALSNEISNRTSADNAVSANLTSAVSQNLSVLSQQASVLSAALLIQLAVVGGTQGLSSTSFVNVSGLSVSVTAGGVYQVQGIVMGAMSVANTVQWTLTFPAMTQATGKLMAGLGNVAAGGDTLSSERFQGGIFDETGSGSTLLSVLHTTTTNRGMFFDALFVVSTTGTVQVQAKVSVTTSPINIFKGSFIKAFKIA